MKKKRILGDPVKSRNQNKCRLEIHLLAHNERHLMSLKNLSLSQIKITQTNYMTPGQVRELSEVFISEANNLSFYYIFFCIMFFLNQCVTFIFTLVIVSLL